MSGARLRNSGCVAVGVDIQVLYAFDLVAQPLLIFGYAFGSGDDTPYGWLDRA
jgi:hypothetical protein